MSASNEETSTVPSGRQARIAVFQRKEVRRTLHNNEWWFVIADVVAALTDSADPTQYINKMRRRDPELAKGWVQIVHPLQRAGANCHPPSKEVGLFPIPFRSMSFAFCT